MANDATIGVSSQILPDYISKVMNGSFTYTPNADGSEKWIYKTTNVSNSSAVLIDTGGHAFISPAATGARSGDVAAADIVRFIYIIHTGTSDGSSGTTEGVMLTLDEGTSAYDVVDGIWIPNGTHWYGRIPNVRADHIIARSVANDLSGNGSGSVQVQVYAIIDDL